MSEFSISPNESFQIPINCPEKFTSELTGPITDDFLKNEKENISRLSRIILNNSAWNAYEENLQLISTNEDAFTQQTSNFTNSIIIRCFILLIRSTKYSFKDKLADRLEILAEDSCDEFYEDYNLSVGSLKNFLTFLTSEIKIKYPKLSLTPENNIYASWPSGNDYLVSVNFLDGNDVRYVFFYQNDKHPEKIDRVSGMTTTDSLISILINKNIQKIVFNE
ncbi:MAG: hypothetical protein KJ808_07010 [Acidobacteria bacterium]|nr:hypothetical protein [Acidobacteriota bacterium]MBU4308123.1 hypothetical protein [Acidobacteriota bacterium]MCG2812556.1 hypothetical protein [Candidatus Aminicenantes bacterium]